MTVQWICLHQRHHKYVTHCAMTLWRLRCHLATGMFWLHYNDMGPRSYMHSLTGKLLVGAWLWFQSLPSVREAVCLIAVQVCASIFLLMGMAFWWLTTVWMTPTNQFCARGLEILDSVLWWRMRHYFKYSIVSSAAQDSLITDIFHEKSHVAKVDFTEFK